MFGISNISRWHPFTCLLALAMSIPMSDATAAYVETILHSFAGGTDGAYPEAALLTDSNGNLYGTTEVGGDISCNVNGQLGCGTVFKITPNGTETVLYAFKGGNDGLAPFAKLINDENGNLYGTTVQGGAGNQGTIFKISADGKETLLYSFKGFEFGDGAYPVAGLLADKRGNRYGTAENGGNFNCNFEAGCGVAFDLASNNTETVLYTFEAGSDGGFPRSDLIADANDNLYGTTESGGRTGCMINGQPGCGIVFKLAPDGAETVLYAFRGGSDGSFPLAGLTADAQGNLYGTTSQGGAAKAGTVFRISPQGRERILLSFNGADGGATPYGALIMDGTGNLYGTTAAGGAANTGTVFKLSPHGRATVLHSFKGGADGANPHAGVIADSAGDLYGTTEMGGVAGYGAVFKISKKVEPTAHRAKRGRNHRRNRP